MYVALLLTPESQNLLRTIYPQPSGWSVKCHHMTINMGPLDKGPAKNIPIGTKFSLEVVGFAQNNLVGAVKVETDCPSANTLKHVTLWVNETGGGKPVMSNQLTDWQPTKRFTLEGVLSVL